MTRTPYYLFFLALGWITSENAETWAPFPRWRWTHVRSHPGLSIHYEKPNPVYIPYWTFSLTGVTLSHSCKIHLGNSSQRLRKERSRELEKQKNYYRKIITRGGKKSQFHILGVSLKVAKHRMPLRSTPGLRLFMEVVYIQFQKILTFPRLLRSYVASVGNPKKIKVVCPWICGNLCWVLSA